MDCEEYVERKAEGNMDKLVDSLMEGFDEVSHPRHYCEGRTIEPIEVVEDWALPFCLASVVKYIARAGRKGDRLEDLLKAQFYLQREIANEEAQRGKE